MLIRAKFVAGIFQVIINVSQRVQIFSAKVIKPNGVTGDGMINDVGIWQQLHQLLRPSKTKSAVGIAYRDYIQVRRIFDFVYGQQC